MSAEITATIKSGKNFDSSWLVFKGTVDEVFHQIEDAFALVPEETNDLSLAELTNLVNNRYQRLEDVSQRLSAVPISSKKGDAQVKAEEADPPWEAEPKAAAEGDPWADVESDPAPAKAEDPVIAAINAAPDLEAIKRLYVQYKDAFSRPEVKAAVTERRKSFS